MHRDAGNAVPVARSEPISLRDLALAIGVFGAGCSFSGVNPAKPPVLWGTPSSAACSPSPTLPFGVAVERTDDAMRDPWEIRMKQKHLCSSWSTCRQI